MQAYIAPPLLIGGGYKARKAEHLAREALDQMGITDRETQDSDIKQLHVVHPYVCFRRHRCA